MSESQPLLMELKFLEDEDFAKLESTMLIDGIPVYVHKDRFERAVWPRPHGQFKLYIQYSSEE